MIVRRDGEEPASLIPGRDEERGGNEGRTGGAGGAGGAGGGGAAAAVRGLGVAVALLRAGGLRRAAACGRAARGAVRRAEARGLGVAVERDLVAARFGARVVLRGATLATVRRFFGTFRLAGAALFLRALTAARGALAFARADRRDGLPDELNPGLRLPNPGLKSCFPC